MKWTIVVSAVLIALACITNTIYNIWFASDRTSIEATIKDVSEEMDSTFVIQQMKDSVHVIPVQKPAQSAPASQSLPQSIND